MTSDTKELGVTGLRFSGGRVQSDFLPELRWPYNIKIFNEMESNDPTVGAMIFAIEMLIRNVKWSVVPFSDKPKHKEQAEFLETCLHDMEKPWNQVIDDFLSFITYGHSVHEMVFKRRKGLNTSNPKFKSKFSDGKFGFRKFPARGQGTIQEWIMDDHGILEGIIQYDPNSARQIPIPESKFMLFRVSSKQDNPEGRSVLRNAYRPWYFKKKIEEIEGMGIARDLSGMPVMYVPQELLDPTASPELAQARNDIETMITSIHRNEQEGLILPSVFDEGSKERSFKFELVTSGGNRQFDINGIVKRYTSQIAQTVLADFILLGQSSAGSFALSSNKTKIFSLALNSWLTSITSVLNHKAVTKLGELNGWNLEELPMIQHGDLEGLDLALLADYFSKLTRSGTIVPTDNLSDWLTDVGTQGSVEAGGEMASEATDMGKPTGDARTS